MVDQIRMIQSYIRNLRDHSEFNKVGYGSVFGTESIPPQQYDGRSSLT
jgi:hypothetical protein